MKSWVLEMTEWSPSRCQFLIREAQVCNPLDKLVLIPFTGPPGWFGICEDDRIRAKNVFTEFRRNLDLVTFIIRLMHSII